MCLSVQLLCSLQIITAFNCCHFLKTVGARRAAGGKRELLKGAAGKRPQLQAEEEMRGARAEQKQNKKEEEWKRKRKSRRRKAERSDDVGEHYWAGRRNEIYGGYAAQRESTCGGMKEKMLLKLLLFSFKPPQTDQIILKGFACKTHMWSEHFLQPFLHHIRVQKNNQSKNKLFQNFYFKKTSKGGKRCHFFCLDLIWFKENLYFAFSYSFLLVFFNQNSFTGNLILLEYKVKFSL